MQAISVNIFSLGYVADMPRGRPSKRQRPPFGERLRALREAAGLSQQQVADKLGMTQTAYAWWERHNVALKPEQMATLTVTFSVSADHLLGTDNVKKRSGGPIGKARRVFDAVSKLPRHQQQKIVDVVETFVVGHSNGYKQAA